MPRIALLPTKPEDLKEMKPRQALPMLNSFMKNALIRGLNVIQEIAPRMTGSHPLFRQFMDYTDIVCDMVILHLRGDEEFLKSISQKCTTYKATNSGDATKVKEALAKLKETIRVWKKDPAAYRASRMSDTFTSLEVALVQGFRERLSNLAPPALPATISEEQLDKLIQENLKWLEANSDLSIILPFCMSHHDILTSKYWPVVKPEVFTVMPKLVASHPDVWKFAPFDPVMRGPNHKVAL